jgi:TatD DNase family protein
MPVWVLPDLQGGTPMKTTPRPLVDAHAHLDLLDRGPEEIRRAVSKGVLAVIGVSMGAESMERTMLLKEAFPENVLPAFGLHPWQIEKEDVEEALARLEENLRHGVAIGEVGLDYRIKTRKALQKEVFRKQLDLAKEKAMPVIVHCRYSHQRALQLVEETGVPQAVFHWYSGPLELIDTIVDRGYFVSATPALAYSRMHQEAIRRAPLKSILLETDCPVAYQGEEATPCDVIRVCEQVASLKGCSSDEVAGQTTENVMRFLGRAWAGRLSRGSPLLANPPDE